MTNLELLATLALLEFLAWGATDITYKLKLMRRMNTEQTKIDLILDQLKDLHIHGLDIYPRN